MPVELRTFKEGEPDEFTIHVAIVNEKEYKVPLTVLKNLKTLFDTKQTSMMSHFKVIKNGTGLNTTYQTVPLGM